MKNRPSIPANWECKRDPNNKQHYILAFIVWSHGCPSCRCYWERSNVAGIVVICYGRLLPSTSMFDVHDDIIRSTFFARAFFHLCSLLYWWFRCPEQRQAVFLPRLHCQVIAIAIVPVGLGLGLGLACQSYTYSANKVNQSRILIFTLLALRLFPLTKSNTKTRWPWPPLRRHYWPI